MLTLLTLSILYQLYGMLKAGVVDEGMKCFEKIKLEIYENKFKQTVKINSRK